MPAILRDWEERKTRKCGWATQSRKITKADLLTWQADQTDWPEGNITVPHKLVRYGGPAKEQPPSKRRAPRKRQLSNKYGESSPGKRSKQTNKELREYVRALRAEIAWLKRGRKANGKHDEEDTTAKAASSFSHKDHSVRREGLVADPIKHHKAFLYTSGEEDESRSAFQVRDDLAINDEIPDQEVQRFGNETRMTEEHEATALELDLTKLQSNSPWSRDSRYDPEDRSLSHAQVNRRTFDWKEEDAGRIRTLRNFQMK